MGNYRFKLSDMMPNAWFYKLKDMSKLSNNNNNNKKKKPSSTSSSVAASHSNTHLSHHHQPRQSYYYTIETTHSAGHQKHYNSPYSNPKALLDSTPPPPPPPHHLPPRKSSSKRKTVYKPSPRRVLDPAETVYNNNSNTFFDSSTESSAELHDFFVRSSSSEYESSPSPSPSPCSCRFSSSAVDIIFDMNAEKSSYSVSELDLRPVLTKPQKPPNKEEGVLLNKYTTSSSSSELEEIQTRGSFSIKIIKEERVKSRKSISRSSAGVKVRANSPRLLASKKLQSHGRKSLSSNNYNKRRSRSSSSSSSEKKKKKKKKKNSNKGAAAVSESFAVVKASVDPERDFRESMMEMIMENNIRTSKDLEELLACYLSLNLDEYHDLIIKAFEQIWFSMPQIHV